MSSSAANESDPSKGTPVPEEAVRDEAADAREAATAESAGEEGGAARTPVPGEQADAEVGRRARRARRRRAQAEDDPAPGPAGGAGSKRKEAEADAERPDDIPSRPVTEGDEPGDADGEPGEQRGADSEEEE
ncbi:MAG TPA: hypothetical protein VK387_00410, partial [Thermoleophilaceae bacterium]|nr:hypothetical protein [Thermoleophilaceae bacterium]